MKQTLAGHMLMELRRAVPRHAELIGTDQNLTSEQA